MDYTLTADETTKLTMFKLAVSDLVQPHHTDHYLTTWLRARNWSLDKAESMFRASMEWRKKMNVDNLLDNWDPPQVLKEYFPWTFLGFSKQGEPVLLFTFGTCDMRGLFQSASYDDCMRYYIYQFEMCLREMEKYCKNSDKNANRRIVIISDMEKLEYRQLFFKTTMQLMIDMCLVYESNYPELLGKAVTVNTPKIFQIAFMTLKYFLSDTTIGKIDLLDSNSDKWKQALLEVIDPSVLPKHWGGTRVDTDGDEYCKSIVRLGGEVPKSYYADTKIKFRSNPDLKTVTVGRKSQLKLDFNVEEQKSVLRWKYMTDYCDIGFGLQFQGKDGKVDDLIEVARHHDSDANIEEGEFVCHDIGKYTIVFDNSYSQLRSKTLSYDVKLTPAVELKNGNN